MQKNILVGVAALGGLILVSSLLLNSSETDPTVVNMAVEEKTLVIPTDIPNFPIYPGSEPKSINDTDGESARDISLGLDVKATVTEINDWYRTELGRNGWSIKSDKNVGGYQIIQGEKDNLYTSMQATNGETAGSVRISQHLKVRK